ncbi:MAG: hypothetical protein JWO76_3280 [Nocardioides sp.]|nr:hypothetical protein [Nocardioides sp.]
MRDDEPRHGLGGEAAHHAAYLDFYRRQLIDGVLELSPDERRRTRLPSGWTPIELLSHVLHMEQRWFVWGFLGEPVEEPWGDWTVDEPWDVPAGTDARWQVPDEVTAEQLADRLRELGRRTTELLGVHGLDEIAADGGRFKGDPADLRWICFHVLQEYARHAGHLDISVELAGG